MLSKRKPKHGRSIFRALFVPLLLIMLAQAIIFYFAAVYGGIEESLSQNAADILSERLINRRNEIETLFGNKWSDLDSCVAALGEKYSVYERDKGDMPFEGGPASQIEFLRDNAGLLISTLRHNEVNGVFLILNDEPEPVELIDGSGDKKYGLLIRDMDQHSNFTDKEDLLLERSPSSLIDYIGCTLDSWWEGMYVFPSRESGDYFYEPLNAAWKHPKAYADDLAYISKAHRVSGSDPFVVSYSVPLISSNGYPYGVLGVELTQRYLSSLMPNQELAQSDKACYILSMKSSEEGECTPLATSGSLYSRCFSGDSVIPTDSKNDTGGFWVTGRSDVEMYGDEAGIKIYDNTSPFENRALSLIALVEKGAMFGYIDRVKLTLFIVSLVCMALGVVSIMLISRRFAKPITDLAKRVRGMDIKGDLKLGRLGITQIDQLVESIEELNRDASKSSARTEFFSRMSHDMRTPMNAIIGFSSPELLENATEAVKDDYLDKINSSGKYLLELINEVLDMTKIESNKITLHVEPVAADSLCAPTIPIVNKLAEDKRIDFIRVNSIDNSAYVLADAQHINQIVMNLLSNAVKFTPGGGTVKLITSLNESPSPDTAVFHLSVSDTGIGMSDEFMNKLYTPFEQENSAREGTGLGLSISKKLVELMGGSMTCRSKKNAGTEFTVDIPLKRTNAGAAVKDSLSGIKLDFEVLADRLVLICEDNAINAQIVNNLLVRKGMRTFVANDGQKGIEAFMNSPAFTFDAILMDIRMPVMDGIRATGVIRSADKPDAKTIPIVALTANAFAEDIESSEKAGMNAHLSKPINPSMLYSTLISLIGGNRKKPV